MANPIVVNCTKNIWTKVATNVTTGQIHKLYEQPQEYLSTYRVTGDIAPTDKAEGIAIFVDDKLTEQISAIAAIDVYIYALEEAGKVRADL